MVSNHPAPSLQPGANPSQLDSHVLIQLYQTLGAAGGIGFPQGRVQSCLIVPPTYVLPLSSSVHALLPA